MILWSDVISVISIFVRDNNTFIGATELIQIGVPILISELILFCGIQKRLSGAHLIELVVVASVKTGFGIKGDDVRGISHTAFRLEISPSIVIFSTAAIQTLQSSDQGIMISASSRVVEDAVQGLSQIAFPRFLIEVRASAGLITLAPIVGQIGIESDEISCFRIEFHVSLEIGIHILALRHIVLPFVDIVRLQEISGRSFRVRKEIRILCRGVCIDFVFVFRMGEQKVGSSFDGLSDVVFVIG